MKTTTLTKVNILCNNDFFLWIKKCFVNHFDAIVYQSKYSMYRNLFIYVYVLIYLCTLPVRKFFWSMVNEHPLPKDQKQTKMTMTVIAIKAISTKVMMIE